MAKPQIVLLQRFISSQGVWEDLSCEATTFDELIDLFVGYGVEGTFRAVLSDSSLPQFAIERYDAYRVTRVKQ